MSSPQSPLVVEITSLRNLVDNAAGIALK